MKILLILGEKFEFKFKNYFSATTVMICLSMTVSLAIGLSWQESLKDDYKKISN